MRAFLPWSGIALAGLLLAHHLSLAWETNPDYNYGWLVPFLTAFLAWRRWETRPSPDPCPSPSKIDPLLALFALPLLPLFLIIEANPDWRLTSWTLALATLGLVLTAFYRAGGIPWLRHFAFPFFFFLIAVPWPTPLENAVIQSLMRVVAVITTEGFNWCGIYAVPQGNLIILANTTVGVDEACSGVRSLQSNLMSSLFVGELFRLSPARRLGLLGIGIGIALLLNLARASFLTWIAWSRGPHGLEAWHDPAGLAFLFISFVVLLALGSRWERKTGGTPSTRCAALPAQPFWVLPLWIVLALAATEFWYRSHEIGATSAPAWSFNWPAEASKTFEPRPIPENIQTILQYGEARHGILRPSGGTEWLVYEFTWPAGRSAAQLARSHSPEVCLPAGGARLLHRGPPVSLNQAPGGPVFEPWIFDWQGEQLLILYALWELVPTGGGLAHPGDFYHRNQRLHAVLEGRRNLGQKVLEIIVPFQGDPETARQNAFEILRSFISQAPSPGQN